MKEFMGIAYPVRKNPQGFFYTESGVNQIKSDLLILLLTNPGERVMLPQFGTPLRSLVFEPNDAMLRQKAKTMIVNSIKKFEPRIVIQSIEVSSKLEEISMNSQDDRTEAEGVLMIKIIFFDPQDIKEVQELKLEVPLSGV